MEAKGTAAKVLLLLPLLLSSSEHLSPRRPHSGLTDRKEGGRASETEGAEREGRGGGGGGGGRFEEKEEGGGSADGK